MIVASLVLLLQVAACIGFGASILWVLRVDRDLSMAQRVVFSFSLGLGTLGCLLFFVGTNGWFTPPVLGAVLLVGVLGLVVFRYKFDGAMPVCLEPFGNVEKGLLAVLALVLLLDIPEALAPPGDGDTLAYHFAMMKQFLLAGRIEFVPRAIDGAAPLLVQMTYLPVLALGGEKSLTLWTMLSGWAAGAMLYVLCREYIGRAWSIAAALVLMTIPAVVYGAGSGQVETRNALFVMLGAFAVGRSMNREDFRYLILAGLCAGFFMGGKYTGLLFAAASGVTLIMHQYWLRRGMVYSIVTLAVGWQWYYWNWTHTGDPVFPMLYEFFGDNGSGVWNAAQDVFFKTSMADAENAVPRNIFWLLAYPFKATMNGARIFESGRTGFGPFVLLALPFAAAGVWRFRQAIRRGPLLSYALIALVYYVLWFYLGGSQRVRHYLPVLPLLLIVVSVASERFVAGTRMGGHLAILIGLTLAIQLAGQGLSALNPLRFVVGGENRQQFLSRNVLYYEPVPWLNANLGPHDRVLVQERTYLYHLDVPYYFAHTAQQALLTIRPQADDQARYLRELEALGITHLLVTEPSSVADMAALPSLVGLTERLKSAGCVEQVRSFRAERRASRTLPGLATSHATLELYRITKTNCALRG